MSHEEKLRSMQDSWKQGIANRGAQADKVPPGIYHAQLQSAELTESQAGRLQIHREHFIREGEWAGAVIHDYLQIETEQGPYFVGMWLESMGKEVPDDPIELEAVVDEIASEAPEYMMKVIHKGDFVNVRIQRLLTEPGAPTAAKTVPAPIAPTSTRVAPAAATAPPKMVRTPKAVAPPPPPEAVDDTDEIIALAQTLTVEVNDDMTREDIIAAICQWNYDGTQLLPEEVSKLREIGASVIGMD